MPLPPLLLLLLLQVQVTPAGCSSLDVTPPTIPAQLQQQLPMRADRWGAVSAVAASGHGSGTPTLLPLHVLADPAMQQRLRSLLLTHLPPGEPQPQTPFPTLTHAHAWLPSCWSRLLASSMAWATCGSSSSSSDPGPGENTDYQGGGEAAASAHTSATATAATATSISTTATTAATAASDGCSGNAGWRAWVLSGLRDLRARGLLADDAAVLQLLRAHRGVVMRPAARVRMLDPWVTRRKATLLQRMQAEVCCIGTTCYSLNRPSLPGVW